MDLKFLIKLFATVVIIIFCAYIGKRVPTLAGLLAAAPITTLIVLLWLWSDKPNDCKFMAEYAKGVFWGIIPTAFFFAAAFVCFKKNLSILPTLSISFAAWFISAVIHQLILKGR
jgi:uncharacterized membrane protein (GlpM family)